MHPCCSVRNPDLMNKKVHKMVVIGPIFPYSFATVKGDHNTNCQSVLGVADPFNLVWQRNYWRCGGLLQPLPMSKRVNVQKSFPLFKSKKLRLVNERGVYHTILELGVNEHSFKHIIILLTRNFHLCMIYLQLKVLSAATVILEFFFILLSSKCNRS